MAANKILVISINDSCPVGTMVTAGLKTRNFDVERHSCPGISELQECMQHIRDKSGEYAAVVMTHAGDFQLSQNLQDTRNADVTVPSMLDWVSEVKTYIPNVVLVDSEAAIGPDVVGQLQRRGVQTIDSLSYGVVQECARKVQHLVEAHGKSGPEGGRGGKNPGHRGVSR